MSNMSNYSATIVSLGGYDYYKKTVKGLQYPIYCRSSSVAGEEVLLDLNGEEYKKHEFLHIGGYTVSPDHSKVAFSLDVTGAESYEVFVKDIASKSLLAIKVPIVKSYYSLEWSADSKGIFYDIHDEIKRPYQIHYYDLNTGVNRKIFEEPDDKFFVSLVKSNSGRFLFIQATSSLTREITVVDAQVGPDGVPKSWVFSPRQFRHRYSIEHVGNFFYILSNKDGKTNYALYRTGLEKTSVENWAAVGEYDSSVSLESLLPFSKFLVLVDRSSSALKRINIFPIKNEDGLIDPSSFYRIPFDASVYNVMADGEQVFESNILRYAWGSLIHPEKTVDYHMETGKSVIRKQKVRFRLTDGSNHS